MPHLAVYGTLRDPDIIRTVFGQDPSPWFNGTTRLCHWSSYYVEGEVYPGLKRQPRAELLLHLYQNIPQDCWEKLLAYEGSGYTLAGVKVKGVTYALFVPDRSTKLSPHPWSLETFQNAHKLDFMQILLEESV